MNFTLQKVCAWSGVATMLLFFGGLLIAGVVPPPSPSLSATEMQTLYSEKLNEYRLGFILVYLSGILVCPFYGLISGYLHEMEKGRMPVCTYTQMVGGGANALLFILGPIFLLATTFRPDRPAELIYMMSDLSWIYIVLPFPPAAAQLLAIAVCIFQDKSAQPMFPKWVAYLNIWVVIGFLINLGGFIFKTGPFAWDGLFSFWLPGAIFGTWYLVMTWQLLKAIDRKSMLQST